VRTHSSNYTCLWCVMQFEPKERLSFMQVVDILEDLLTRPLDDLEVSTVNTEVAKTSEELPNGK
jgi:hypothetical protein